MRRAVRVVLASALALGACAPAAFQYGRDGLAPVDREVRANLAAGRYGSAYEAAFGKDAQQRDRLLRALSVGALGLYASRTDSSVWALDRAWALTEDRWSRKVSALATTVAVSEYQMPFSPGATERLFIPFYGALSWLARGERDEAAVEARRLVQLLGEARADSADTPDRDVRGVLHYVAGAVFDAAGDHGAADVAYRNAERLVTVPVSRDTSVADSLSGDVVVVLEQGFVGHPVPRDQTIWMSRDEYGMLRHDGDDRGYRAARDIQLREREFGYRGRGSRSSVDVGVSINWSEFRDGRDVAPQLRLASAGAVQELRSDGNVSRAVRADFERDQPGRFTRALIRAAARGALVKAASDQLAKVGDDDDRPRRVEKKRGDAGDKQAKDKKGDEGDGPEWGRIIAGIGFFAIAAASEVNDRPDLRSWNLLPHDLRVVRLRLPAGEQDVRAIVDGQEILVGRANVRAGQVTVLSQRFFRSPAVAGSLADLR